MDISNQLINVLVKVADSLNKLNIEYCLIGGLAVSMLSKPRATEDVDFLLLLDKEKEEKLVDELNCKFKIIQNKKPFSLKNITIWRLILQDENSEDYDFSILDFIFADNMVYKETLTSAVEIQLFGTSVKVARIDDLIKVKQLSGRNIDLNDVVELKKARNSLK